MGSLPLYRESALMPSGRRLRCGSCSGLWAGVSRWGGTRGNSESGKGLGAQLVTRGVRNSHPLPRPMTHVPSQQEQPSNALAPPDHRCTCEHAVEIAGRWGFAGSGSARGDEDGLMVLSVPRAGHPR
ncbi:hypothetical protein FIBSPDRAFT_129299 [Athelia psychrophila]|uniref:Uncharacterized protein n=1 Tax=Athelia psychrophila TaxID=1759441 RepID=A0A166CHN3_9AGAM|nr:hypothetical protein FIBSPDRAFT_129299 [Fibularhizoctonia sp. CBS 109695]